MSTRFVKFLDMKLFNELEFVNGQYNQKITDKIDKMNKSKAIRILIECANEKLMGSGCGLGMKIPEGIDQSIIKKAISLFDKNL